jgi:hypothetical protein
MMMDANNKTDDKPSNPDDRAVICSGKGCHARATYGLLWNNPKLHTPERRKTWVACDEHLQYLSHFLSIRGFLKDTVPMSELNDKQG